MSQYGIGFYDFIDVGKFLYPEERCWDYVNPKDFSSNLDPKRKIWKKQCDILDRKESEILSYYLLNDLKESDSFSPLNPHANIRKGLTEDVFWRLLNNTTLLRGRIFQNQIVRFGIVDDECAAEYYPDIVVQASERFNIDVEIDEPYSLETGEPIHCDCMDDMRNSYFSDNGWFVIRFSEKQITEHPDQCLRIVRMVTLFCASPRHVSLAIRNLAKLYIEISHDVWTYDEAEEFAKIDGRLHQ